MISTALLVGAVIFFSILYFLINRYLYFGFKSRFNAKKSINRGLKLYFLISSVAYILGTVQLFPFQYIASLIHYLNWGHVKKGDTHFFVTAGAGTWGPPVKTVGKSEIKIIDVIFK